MMMNMAKRLELLAPAGDFPSLIAAVESGADSVYFGLEEFNMRQNAKNFKIEDLQRINEICKNVKKYLTINVIIYDEDLEKLEKLIERVKGKINAVICWDLSVIELCKRHNIPFHISTQASIANSAAARFYKNLGAERVVLARELNLKQIKEISKIMPVECFIHGAMCVSISGRCFTSQFLTNKSANRGECAQFCRRSYKITDPDGNELELDNNKVMSAKDLCCLPFIEQLKKAGITAFKIEGRNRSPEYVKTTVSVYRNALDNELDKKQIEESMEKLKTVYNRGFSSGFYLGQPTDDDFSKTEYGESTEKKVSLGRVQNYWHKMGVAAVKIQSKHLKIGDEIYITGNTTGVIRTRVETMEIDHKPVKDVRRGKTVGIKVPECRSGDEVFLIQKNKSR